MSWLMQIPFIKEIGILLAGMFALIGYGKLKERQGRKDLESEIATENLEGFKDASKKLSEIQRPVDADDARRKLRERQAGRKRKP